MVTPLGNTRGRGKVVCYFLELLYIFCSFINFIDTNYLNFNTQFLLATFFWSTFLTASSN